MTLLALLAELLFVVDYEINVEESLLNYKKIYEEKIEEGDICQNLFK